MQFLLVYIREAHAVDSEMQILSGPLVEDPNTDRERHGLAGTCVQDLGLSMIEAVVDRVDDRVSRAYDAWPDRLWLIGRDGRIAYRGGRGPHGFDPQALGEAIARELEKKDGP